MSYGEIWRSSVEEDRKAAEERDTIQALADLELAILGLVREFERTTGRLVDDIRTEKRSEPLETYRSHQPYWSKYTDRVSVKLVDVGDAARWKRDAIEKSEREMAEAQAEKQRKEAEAVAAALAVEVGAGLQQLTVDPGPALTNYTIEETPEGEKRRKGKDAR
jgi:hypothetical protein